MAARTCVAALARRGGGFRSSHGGAPYPIIGFLLSYPRSHPTGRGTVSRFCGQIAGAAPNPTMALPPGFDDTKTQKNMAKFFWEVNVRFVHVSKSCKDGFVESACTELGHAIPANKVVNRQWMTHTYSARARILNRDQITTPLFENVLAYMGWKLPRKGPLRYVLISIALCGSVYSIRSAFEGAGAVWGYFSTLDVSVSPYIFSAYYEGGDYEFSNVMKGLEKMERLEEMRKE